MLVKRGRPRKRDRREVRNIEVRVKLSEDDHDKLVDIASDLGVSFSEVVRRSIGIFYDMRRY